jgi:hypothetical protein
MKALRSVSLAAAIVASLAASSAFAGAIHDASLFTNTLAANDDGSTGAVAMGFSVDLNGTTYANTFVNNNGNITFTGPRSQFTPSAINTGAFGPIFAPFFADVDTRAPGSALVSYGAATLDGRNVFGVNYIHVGVYNSQPIFNSFQLILTDRSDIGAGDIDIQFNYDDILWEAGTASGAPGGGLGGTSALVGYWTSAGNNATLPGSQVNGALVNGGVNALISHSLNSNIAGQYNFQVRNGAVVNDTPEPGALALVGIALAGLSLLSRKKRAA